MHCPHMMLENSKAWARQATSLQNPYSFWLVFTVQSRSYICLVFLECLSDCTHKQRPLSWLKQDFLFVFVSSLIISTKVTVTTKWGLCEGQLINTSATVAWFWGMSLHGFLLSFRRTTKEVITHAGTTGSYHHTHLSAQRALYPLILLPRMCACACVIAGVCRDTRMKVWRQLQVLVISCHFIGDRVSLFSCYYKFQTSWPTSFIGFYVLLTGAMKLHLTSHKLWESGFRSLSLCNKHFTHWNIFLASLMPFLLLL